MKDKRLDQLKESWIKNVMKVQGLLEKQSGINTTHCPLIHTAK